MPASVGQEATAGAESARPAAAEPTSTCCAPSRPTGVAATEAPVVHSGSRAVDDTADIPGGMARVGTDRPILDLDDESPVRKVRVKPFRMDRTTVTNARFKAFVDDTGYVTEAERIGDSFVFAGNLPDDAPPSRAVAAAPWWREIKGANWRLINGPGSEAAWRPDHPVVHVSWNDANAFATWASGRLPTEAEWEHAARGGLGDARFPWGDSEPNDTDHFPCNIWQGDFPRANRGLDGYIATAPARSFAPNGYGLFNLVGNVWEWTSQAFKVRASNKAARSEHAGKAGYKLLKGGSFLCHASYCYRYRIAARTGNSPDSTTTHQGFRLVYDPA